MVAEQRMQICQHAATLRIIQNQEHISRELANAQAVITSITGQLTQRFLLAPAQSVRPQLSFVSTLT